MRNLFQISLTPKSHGTNFEFSITMTPYTAVGLQGVTARFVLDENMTTTIKTLRDMADLLEKKSMETKEKTE